jgi:hypothetical protein
MNYDYVFCCIISGVWWKKWSLLHLFGLFDVLAAAVVIFVIFLSLQVVLYRRKSHAIFLSKKKI